MTDGKKKEHKIADGKKRATDGWGEKKKNVTESERNMTDTYGKRRLGREKKKTFRDIRVRTKTFCF